METIIWTFLDLLLVTALLALGWASLASRDSRRAVVLFMSFGLVLALVWVRLRAPDIALAEAAIGAGLTGGLLFSGLRDEKRHSAVAGTDTAIASRVTLQNVLLTALSAGLAVMLGFAFVYALTEADPTRLAEQVFANLADSGVSNPVTGVLLNFRAYDTLLELAVMLAAVLGVLALGPARSGYLAPGPVFGGLTRWIAPLLVLVGGYLLWKGAHAPGGAFQAGALLAAAGVLLRLAGDVTGGLPRGSLLRGLLVAGVAVFMAVGLSVMLSGRQFLDYPISWAGSLILTIEAAATLAIAATLVTAFLCGEPQGRTAGNDSSRAAKPRSRPAIDAGDTDGCSPNS